MQTLLNFEPKNESVSKKKPTNLDPLFIELVVDFAHLLSNEAISRKEFSEIVKTTYSTENPKTALFYQSIFLSDFDTIKLSTNRENILFNH